VRSLLVTNDFPPKVGGIQSYLWELWRRLPPDEVAVLTTPQAGDAAFDAAQAFPVLRTRQRVLLPTPLVAREIEAQARVLDVDLVVLDPALPLGALAPRLSRPYGIVLHGAEVTVPGRMPGTRGLLGAVLRGARTVVAAGRYPAAEGERAAGRPLPITVVPPGVDPAAFRPLDAEGRVAARRELGLPEDALLVLGLSRLVPRKGFDVLLRAAGRLAPWRPDLLVAIGGSGRDRARLERVARTTGAPTRFLGRVPDADMWRLYACADVFAAPCRDRWFGLEQEGFGIVFIEAAAAGTPAVAGRSGGSHEAVEHGVTGLVVDRPADTGAVAAALAALLDDPDRRTAMGAAARRRVEAELDYDLLAGRLRTALAAAVAPR
jgi:phosphatidylinositol alpha-1,6-mannosyltransferase